jgi:hypothetical protein
MTINFQVFGLTGLYMLLLQEERNAQEEVRKHEAKKAQASIWHDRGPPVPIFGPLDEATQKRIVSLLEFATLKSNEMELQGVLDRIKRFQQNLRLGRMDLAAFAAEVRILKETLEDGIRLKYFYRYSDDKARRLLRVDADWASVIAPDKFPSVRDDAHAATDCWALGHPTACVFHCMRVLEHGLKALASDVGETFDLQQWQNIIEQIEARISAEGKTFAAWYA